MSDSVLQKFMQDWTDAIVAEQSEIPQRIAYISHETNTMFLDNEDGTLSPFALNGKFIEGEPFVPSETDLAGMKRVSLFMSDWELPHEVPADEPITIKIAFDYKKLGDSDE